MRRYKYRTDPTLLAAQAEAIISNAKMAPNLRKAAKILKPIFEGKESPESQASTCQYSAFQIRELRSQVDKEGFASLTFRRKPGSGKRSVLTDEQKERVAYLLDENKPQLYGYDVWNGITMSAYVLLEFDVKLSVRSCQYLFHKLGFSHIRGGRYPKRREKFRVARHDFQQTLKMAVADKGSIIVYMDEVHFKVAMTITAGWYRKGSNPQRATEIGGGKVMYVGFVVPSTGQLFVYEVDVFNYKTTMQSIRKFVKDANLPPEMKIVLVLDNASWHKACLDKIHRNYGGHYQDVKERVEFLFLSPYSPDLNAIEMVWRLTRYECTHNVYFSGLQVLRETLEKYFARYREPNAKLQSLTNFSTFEWDAPSVEPSVAGNFNFDIEVVRQWLTYPVIVDQSPDVVDVEATPVTTAIACPYAGTTLPALISDPNTTAVAAEEPINTNFADVATKKADFELTEPTSICEQNATSVAVEEAINIELADVKVCAVLGDSSAAEIDLNPPLEAYSEIPENQSAFFADTATDGPSKADRDMKATAFEDTVFQGEAIIGPFEPLDPIGAEDVPKRPESGVLGRHGEAPRPKPMMPFPQMDLRNR